MKQQRPFLALWTLAVIATVAAFVLHLGLRGRTVDMGYKLGRARAEQARLREMKRVLSLEAASYETPQRVEMVARTLLGMNPPPPERVIPLRPMAPMLPPEDSDGAGDVDQPAPKPTGWDNGAPSAAPSATITVTVTASDPAGAAPANVAGNGAPVDPAAPNDVPAAVFPADPGAQGAPGGAPVAPSPQGVAP